jgi:alpha-tubulin suppressor-like RCC1 family protein
MDPLATRTLPHAVVPAAPGRAWHAPALALWLLLAGCGGGGGAVLATPPQITQQPASLAVTEPDAARFEVVALGSPPFTYRWERSDDGGANWSAAGGGRELSVAPTSRAADDGARFRVTVTDVDGLAATSSVATLGVGAALAAPVITAHPQNLTVGAGATATFICTASGSAVAYRWQVSADGGVNWNDIAGADNAAYTTPALQAGDDGARYRCRAGNGAGDVASDAALLTVLAAPPPVNVEPRLVAGGAGSYALARDGRVWAWGMPVGDGTPGGGTSNVPVPVPGIADAIDVAAGWLHVLILRSDGSVWAFGNNARGQLGDGTRTDRASPVPVPGATGVRAVAAGGYTSVALRGDGSLLEWGADMSLTVGPDPWRLVPTPVAGLSDVQAVALASNFLEPGHALALRGDGSVWAWGWNGDGQLGDGSVAARAAPVPVAGLAGVTQVAAGERFSLARRSDDTLWGWGWTDNGQLPGTLQQLGHRTPQALAPAGPWSAIAAGHDFALGLRNGVVVGWGEGDRGQLGIDLPLPFNAPAPVTLLPLPATAIAAGAEHTLARTADGAVWAWGRNVEGQLGDGSSTQRNRPVRVNGLNLP